MFFTSGIMSVRSYICFSSNVKNIYPVFILLVITFKFNKHTHIISPHFSMKYYLMTLEIDEKKYILLLLLPTSKSFAIWNFGFRLLFLGVVIVVVV